MSWTRCAVPWRARRGLPGVARALKRSTRSVSCGTSAPAFRAAAWLWTRHARSRGCGASASAQSSKPQNGAARHRRMLAQTAERQGLKKLPAPDWGCLMRRYTETTSGAGAQWIEMTDARSREGIATPDTPGALGDARSTLQLLRILARREAAETE